MKPAIETTSHYPGQHASSASLEAAILAIVRMNNEEGIGIIRITAALGMPKLMVRSRVSSMSISGRLRSTGEGSAIRYFIPNLDRATSRTVTSFQDGGGTYTGSELRRNVDLEAGRFEAFARPSRMGDRLHWPDGRVTRLDGEAVAA